MPLSAPVDGFRLEYERAGSGPPWCCCTAGRVTAATTPRCVPLLRTAPTSVVPDLRGFGGSDKRAEDPERAYSAAAQARSVIGLIDELGLERPLLAGYDIGSRIAQEIARTAPGRVRGLVISPPVPGIGERILGAGRMREFWYQQFHRLDLAERLIDGDVAAGARLPRALLDALVGSRLHGRRRMHLDRLAAGYGEPGAFVASIGWYRGGAGAVARSLGETAPAPATGSPRRRRSSGPSMTRFSRASGATGSTASSPRPSCGTPTASATSSRSRRRRRSPRRSGSAERCRA